MDTDVAYTFTAIPYLQRNNRRSQKGVSFIQFVFELELKNFEWTLVDSGVMGQRTT